LVSLIFATHRNRSSLARSAALGHVRRVARGIYSDELDRTDEEVVAACCRTASLSTGASFMVSI